MSGSRSIPIEIDGETIEVWTSKDGKAWHASASFRGHPIVERGPTESSALSSWRAAANHAANE